MCRQTEEYFPNLFFLWFRFLEDIVKILFLQNSSALNWYLMCQSDVMDGRTYVLILTMSFGRFSRNLTSLLGPRLFSLYLTMCGFKILSLAVTKVPLAVLSVCQSWSYASLRAHKQFWTQFFLEKDDQRRSWQENDFFPVIYSAGWVLSLQLGILPLCFGSNDRYIANPM